MRIGNSYAISGAPNFGKYRNITNKKKNNTILPDNRIPKKKKVNGELLCFGAIAAASLLIVSGKGQAIADFFKNNFGENVKKSATETIKKARDKEALQTYKRIIAGEKLERLNAKLASPEFLKDKSAEAIEAIYKNRSQLGALAAVA